MSSFASLALYNSARVSVLSGSTDELVGLAKALKSSFVSLALYNVRRLRVVKSVRFHNTCSVDFCFMNIKNILAIYNIILNTRKHCCVKCVELDLGFNCLFNVARNPTNLKQLPLKKPGRTHRCDEIRCDTVFGQGTRSKVKRVSQASSAGVEPPVVSAVARVIVFRRKPRNRSYRDIGALNRATAIE